MAKTSRQKIAVSGATFVDAADIKLHEQVVVILVGECTADGRKASATQGDYESRPIKMSGALVAEGAEARELIARVAESQDASDAGTVTEMFGDVDSV